MPLAQPEIVTENNQTYIRWGNLRYWVDDLDQTTIGCIGAACEAVGESTDHGMLEAEIDERVDATEGAVAVYLTRKNWELVTGKIIE
jgi:hypothetical protein